MWRFNWGQGDTVDDVSLKLGSPEVSAHSPTFNVKSTKEKEPDDGQKIITVSLRSLLSRFRHCFMLYINGFQGIAQTVFVSH